MIIPSVMQYMTTKKSVKTCIHSGRKEISITKNIKGKINKREAIIFLSLFSKNGILLVNSR
jgi:hypothetical protein